MIAIFVNFELCGLTNADKTIELTISSSDKFSEKYQAKRSTNINVYDNETLLTSSMFRKELMSSVQAQKLSKKKTLLKIPPYLDTIFAIQLIHALCFVTIASIFAMQPMFGVFISPFVVDLFTLRECVFTAIHNKPIGVLACMICWHVILATIASIVMLIICSVEKNVILSYSVGSCQILFWVSMNIELILSNKNESRFTSHDEQCYNKLSKWLHKNKRCNNLCYIISKDDDDIKILNDSINDKVIRLIAINLCLDSNDKKLRNTFYKISMSTINSLIHDNTTKLSIDNIIETDDQEYMKSVSIKQHFINRNIKCSYDKLKKESTTRTRASSSKIVNFFRVWVVPILLIIRFYFGVAAFLCAAFLVWLVAPIYMTIEILNNNNKMGDLDNFEFEFEFQIVTIVALIVSMIMLIIYIVLMFKKMDHFWIELDIVPSMKTYEKKVRISDSHLEYIENCYQNMISYKVKCQIIKQYVSGSQNIANIVLNYLPQLGEIKFDMNIISDSQSQKEESKTSNDKLNEHHSLLLH